MRRRYRIYAVTIGVAALFTTTSFADQSGQQNERDRLVQEIRTLREKVSEVDRLREEVAELRRINRSLRTGDDEGTWLTEARAQAVRHIVHDLLADADQRASLLQSGATAGHDGNFFIQSADGRFRLELAGHLQVRYTLNDRQDSGGDDTLSGFNLRRAKFKPSGHITLGDRRFEFGISLAGDQDSGDPPIFEDYYLQTDINDRIAIRAGRWQQPFGLQNLTSSSRQLAVERSAVHELFNVDRSEGVMVFGQGDNIRWFASYNDGRDAEKTDFNEDMVDFALTGRLESKLAGEWSQYKDPATAWTDEPFAAFLGGAVHYEVGETGTPADNNNFLLYTADLTIESGGFGVLLAGYGLSTDNETGSDFDDFGLLVEAGYFIVPDTFQPFVRYELIMADDSRAPVMAGDIEEDTSIITAGFNWYQAKHNAKFTLDLVYALDPLFASAMGPGAEPGDIASSSLGLRSDAAGEDGQVALRVQYQIKW